MGTFVAVALTIAVGVLLTLAATRATATVKDGRAFVKWMLAVFATYLALISLPVFMGF